MFRTDAEVIMQVQCPTHLACRLKVPFQAYFQVKAFPACYAAEAVFMAGHVGASNMFDDRGSAGLE